MTGKRINVLIYSDQGASLSSVRHATWSLRRLLGPHYSIQTVSSDQIIKEPWHLTCALLVFPGGADSGYCRLLNGAGNRRIRQYVRAGGKYLGLCAGGYYGSGRCEFEVGKKGMEVVGDRELAFFPGTCRGLAFKGFVYQSEAGARAVELTVNQNAFPADVSPTFKSYYNGGGVFVDTEKLAAKGIEILATFTDNLSVESGQTKAAVLFAKVDDGAAILTGPHPEFAGANLNRDEPSNPNYGELVDALIMDDKKRADFMRACLSKLGLEVTTESHTVPSLSRLHLSSSEPGAVMEWLQSWRENGIVVEEDGLELIKCEQDVFKLEKADSFNMSSLKDALSTPVKKAANALFDAISTPTKPSSMSTSKTDATDDSSPGSEKLTTTVVPHTNSLPDAKETPHFNHAAFFTNLKHYHSLLSSQGFQNPYGRLLLYGEVVTSTQTLLEKNPTLLSNLPIGMTCTATTQVSGRGRGTNVWVSPPGSLMFSTMLKHPMSLSAIAPVTFIQNIAALAIVDGINNYASPAPSPLPRGTIKLKWPNDIYALDPSSVSSSSLPMSDESYIKIGGILINTTYSSGFGTGSGDYTCIIGIGLNLSNASPTTSLNTLLQLQSQSQTTSPSIPHFSPEKLLASILTSLQTLYTTFTQTGWSRFLEEKYHTAWLHTDQLVTLEMEENARARIKGITRDWGLLVAEEIDDGGRQTGRKWELQSDGNSFDFFKGLIKRKG